MRDIERTEPGHKEADSETRLRKENQDLKRQLLELKSLAPSQAHDTSAPMWHPSGITIWVLFLSVIVLFAIAFLAGYIPFQKRQALIRAEAHQQEQTVPRVEVIRVERSSRTSDLELPGSVQAITEGPILARSSGYLRRRNADIGDRVKAGQIVAEIEAPEMEDQIREARANLQLAQASLDQAVANHEQGKSDLEFTRTTARRWADLSTQGIVSKQDNDQYQTQLRSKLSNVLALEKAIGVQRASIGAAEANLARLQKLQGYSTVRAPFDGVITLRNVDVGTLVTAGDTLLYRIAQTNTVRTYVNVPQASASSIHRGQAAKLRVSNLPGRVFAGAVERTSNTLDPSSRTMLVEIQIPNPDGMLLPGMFAQVDLSNARVTPPLVVPSDALVIGADGTRVALLRPDQRVHLQKVEMGRDYGDRIEILSGLQEGDSIIPNPGDLAREGLVVNSVPAVEKTGR